jgi:hypothetical protein
MPVGNDADRHVYGLLANAVRDVNWVSPPATGSGCHTRDRVPKRSAGTPEKLRLFRVQRITNTNTVP